MRTESISLWASKKGSKATLAEIYGKVIENLQKTALSTSLKSQAYTGNPISGSVEFKRFVNADPQEYGTARAAGKGSQIIAPPTTVNLDQHKEIIEECSKFDMDTFGVPSILARRADSHVATMSAALDREFFATGARVATIVTPTAIAINEMIEEVIQTAETTKTDYVDGVDRALIDVILDPLYYGKMRNFLDTQANPNVDTAAEEFGMYHGVKIYNSTRLPSDCHLLLQVHESIAQPVVVNQYSNPEKIPLSNDYAISLFYDYGTKELTPDLLFKLGE